jgi:hypothetical protein
MRDCLKRGGLFLYCDHAPGSLRNSVLGLARQARSRALKEAGFASIKRILDEGGMALDRPVA